jgi:hypothetical protein
MWFLASVILFDLLMLPHEPLLGIGVVITLELLLVVLFGRSCGIDDVEVLIQRLSGMFSKIQLPGKKSD